MWNGFRSWLNSAPIDNPIERRQSPMLQVMLIGIMIAASLALLNILTAPVSNQRRLLGIVVNTLYILCAASGLVALRRGHFRLAVLIPTTTSALILGLFLIAVGLRNGAPFSIVFTIPIILAGLLTGRPSIFFIIGIGVATMLTVLTLERVAPTLTGFVPVGDSTSTIVVVFILVTSLSGLFLDRFSHTLSTTLSETLVRERELEQSGAALELRTSELEREIGERLRAEAALRESEERYRLLAENSSDLISLIDLDQGEWRVYASPSFRTVLGHDPSALIGASAFALVHPNDVKSVHEQLSRVATQGAVQITNRLRHADGSWRWFEVQVTAIALQERRYALAVGRDITERKRLEAQFLQVQKMESIGRLAGGVAHDFNNLLTAMLGNLELALDAQALDHRIRGDLEEAHKAAERAAILTHQLLAFASKQVIEPQIINLNLLIDELHKLLQRLIGENVTLIMQPGSDMVHVKADPGQIEQLIVNMAVNARDAMPNGGKLTIATRNIALDQEYAQHVGVTPGAYVLLTISDTGDGMDETTLHHIFEPFFTTKSIGKGTGLGLATCYGIVKQHGGQIVPYSEPGHGSTFQIYLPHATMPVSERAPHQQTAMLPRGTETVLLAEDEATVRTLVVRVLREYGYTVLEASDGDEALRLSSERATTPIDLLLTDVVMPQLSGIALAEQIGALRPGLKVLYISGYIEHARVGDDPFTPSDNFLHKPFTPAALVRKVRDVLDSPPVA
jgi:two-component system cell cycle sensor histidine kinase/response regulator CckA